MGSRQRKSARLLARKKRQRTRPRRKPRRQRRKPRSAGRKPRGRLIRKERKIWQDRRRNGTNERKCSSRKWRKSARCRRSARPETRTKMLWPLHDCIAVKNLKRCWQTKRKLSVEWSRMVITRQMPLLTQAKWTCRMTTSERQMPPRLPRNDAIIFKFEIFRDL